MKKSLSDFTKEKHSERAVFSEKASPKKHLERVGVTLRLSRTDWERLHYLSIQERKKIQALLLEGINRVFEERGLEKMNDA